MLVTKSPCCDGYYLRRAHKLMHGALPAPVVCVQDRTTALVRGGFLCNAEINDGESWDLEFPLGRLADMKEWD
jgi:hypothetical protein